MIAYTVTITGHGQGDMSVAHAVVPDWKGGMTMELPQLPFGGSLTIEFEEVTAVLPE